ncbi:UNVERIFIED_CONTAM: hypothetical protein GTU68_043661 [Idotea baltica]|nr:hypothetical protein [Idotea baltica]
MHNPALDAAKIDAEYIRLHITPDELETALRELPKQGFVGTNVTIPHKTEVAKIVDHVTEVARRTGAVNTVLVNPENGELTGHSTDGPGFQRAIREEFSVDLKDLRILILGAGGGAGRAVAVQCAMERCERLILANRTLSKVKALEAELEEFFHDPDRLEGPADRLSAIAMEDPETLADATSIGMKTTDPPLVPGHEIQPHHLVYDMIYAPPRTRLIADAEAAGARAANGLSMLLWQGALAFEFWFNQEAPVEAMRQGLVDALED